jgi:hypothetical protein
VHVVVVVPPVVVVVVSRGEEGSGLAPCLVVVQ